MTLEEAIKHCEEVAEQKKESIAEYEQNPIHYEKEIRYCKECAEEHRQLAEWLRELKKYRVIFKKVGKILAENGYTMDDLDNIFKKANDEEVNADGKLQ